MSLTLTYLICLFLLINLQSSSYHNVRNIKKLSIQTKLKEIGILLIEKKILLSTSTYEKSSDVYINNPQKNRPEQNVVHICAKYLQPLLKYIKFEIYKIFQFLLLKVTAFMTSKKLPPANVIYQINATTVVEKYVEISSIDDIDTDDMSININSVLSSNVTSLESFRLSLGDQLSQKEALAAKNVLTLRFSKDIDVINSKKMIADSPFLLMNDSVNTVKVDNIESLQEKTSLQNDSQGLISKESSALDQQLLNISTKNFTNTGLNKNKNRISSSRISDTNYNNNLNDNATEILSSTEKLKIAGISGVISYTLIELAFWIISIPLIISSYHTSTNEWLDFANEADRVRLRNTVNFACF